MAPQARPRSSETGTALLPREEGGRGTLLPCKHMFSGWKAETCPHSGPRHTCSQTSLSTAQGKPRSALGIATRRLRGDPRACSSEELPRGRPKFRPQNLIRHRGPNRPHRLRASIWVTSCRVGNKPGTVLTQRC